MQKVDDFCWKCVSNHSTCDVLTPKVESFFHAVTMAIMIVPASSGASSFPPFYSSVSFPSLLIAAILPLP